MFSLWFADIWTLLLGKNLHGTITMTSFCLWWNVKNPFRCPEFKNLSLIFKLLKKLLRNPHNQEAKYIVNTEDAVAVLNTHNNKLWSATGPNIVHLLHLLPLHSCGANMLCFKFVLRCTLYTLVKSKIQSPEKSKCFEILHTYLNKGTYEWIYQKPWWIWGKL